MFIITCENHYDTLKKFAQIHGIKNIRSFGTNKSAHYRILSTKIIDNNILIKARIGHYHIRYCLNSLRDHWIMMSLAVLSAVDILGGDILQAAKDIKNFKPLSGRGEILNIEVPIGHGNFFIIDDSYNANPISMLSAIKYLAQVKRRLGGIGRTIAVLGDMLELGTKTQDAHINLIYPLIYYNIEYVYTVGCFMKNLYQNLPNTIRSWHFQNIEEVIIPIKQILKKNDIILVKGSKSIECFKLIKNLKHNC